MLNEKKKSVLAERIAEARDARGLSQGQLGIEVAKLVPDRDEDYDQQLVSKWETDGAKPRLPALVAVAKVLGVSVDWLLGLTEHRSGLPSDHWIIDLDVYEAGVAGTPPPSDEALGCPIPPRFRIVTSTVYARMRAEARAGRVNKRNRGSP